MKQEHYDRVISVACTVCDAAPFQYCVSKNGKRATQPHVVRIEAFAATEHDAPAEGPSIETAPATSASDEFASLLLGTTVEEARVRRETIETVKGGFLILISLEGLDWTLNRLAEMVVDGELSDWQAKLVK